MNNPGNIEEFKKFYNYCVEYYKYIEEASNDYDIQFDEVDEIFEILLSDGFKIMFEGNNEIIDGITFYKMLFDKLKLVSTYDELIDFIQLYLFDNSDSPHLSSRYNIVSYCMKMITHLEWRICYDLAPRLMRTPEEAIGDILHPIEASHREIKKIILYLEKKLDKKVISEAQE